MTFILCGAALVILAAVFLTRWIWTLKDPEQLDHFLHWITSLGIGGYLLLLLIQYIQIVIAFIPGGPLQVISGILFGPWGGISIFLIGTLLASATVFPLVRHYGHRIVRFFIRDKQLHEYH